MSEYSFGRNQLKKHGWTEGSGLGREEAGMKEAIKVSVKNNKTGIGHDPGAEFTHHWWQDIFNKTASSIEVESTQDGSVAVTKKVSSNTLRPSRRKTKPLYGHFIKGSTLKEEDGHKVEEIEERSSDSEEDELKDSNRPSEGDLFEECGGRTAHKGARHGLGLNGKLQRIQVMEEKYLEQLKAQKQVASKRGSEEQDGPRNKKGRKKREKLQFADCDNPVCLDDTQKKKKKIKKKKRKYEEMKEDHDLKLSKN